MQDISKQVFEMTNQERARFGLPPLKPEVGLDSLARYHSSNMLKQKFFSHTDLFGDEVSGRAKKRYPELLYSSIGENIAHTSGLDDHLIAANIMDGWMKSKGHRENILSNQFTHLGVGIAQERSVFYATQNFATPIVKSIGIPSKSASLNQTIALEFLLLADFPARELNAILEYPDSNARFQIDERYYTLGYEPLSVQWLAGDKHFRLNLKFDQGPGVYQICFGRGDKYFAEGFKILAR